MGQIIAYVLFTVIAVFFAKWFIQKDGHPKGLFYLFFAEVLHQRILGLLKITPSA